jgi:Ulp1 family protease
MEKDILEMKSSKQERGSNDCGIFVIKNIYNNINRKGVCRFNSSHDLETRKSLEKMILKLVGKQKVS